MAASIPSCVEAYVGLCGPGDTAPRPSEKSDFDAAEVWHYYAGAALKLTMAVDARIETCRLGPAISTGERPQAVVPANCWQMAESTGDWTLVGCTVAPGFDFAAFELAPPGWSPAG